MIKFGVAGNSLSFYEQGYKTTKEAALWCRRRDIDMFEYSFGKGVTLNEKTAKDIGAEFASNGLEMSAHAPYYINFANPDAEMIQKSIGYVLRTAKKIKDFGCGDRVVVHPATQGKMTRNEAFDLTIQNIKLLIQAIQASEFSDIKFCLETMGKIGQIGTLEEIMELVSYAPFFYPCIDFGHLNARTLGGIKSKDDYKKIIDYMLKKLPEEKVSNMHVHFSKIMYGPKGEIKHLTFEDGAAFGPDYKSLMEIFAEYKLNPKIICESNGTQAEDTITMKNYYYSLI